MDMKLVVMEPTTEQLIALVLGGVGPYTFSLQNSDGITIQSGGLLGLF